MAVQTTQKTFERNKNTPYNLLIVSANGGSLAVEYERSDGALVVAETYTTDAVVEFNLRRTRVRITPAGGAEYEIA